MIGNPTFCVTHAASTTVAYLTTVMYRKGGSFHKAEMIVAVAHLESLKSPPMIIRLEAMCNYFTPKQ